MPFYDRPYSTDKFTTYTHTLNFVINMITTLYENHFSKFSHRVNIDIGSKDIYRRPTSRTLANIS